MTREEKRERERKKREREKRKKNSIHSTMGYSKALQTTVALASLDHIDKMSVEPA